MCDTAYSIRIVVTYFVEDAKAGATWSIRTYVLE